MLMRDLAIELAPARDHGEQRRARRNRHAHQHQAVEQPRSLEGAPVKIPLNRLGTPNDVAGTVAFLGLGGCRLHHRRHDRRGWRAALELLRAVKGRIPCPPAFAQCGKCEPANSQASFAAASAFYPSTEKMDNPVKKCCLHPPLSFPAGETPTLPETRRTPTAPPQRLAPS